MNTLRTCLFLVALMSAVAMTVATTTPATLDCLALCRHPLTTDLPEFVCGYNGVTLKNNICPNGMTTISCKQSLPLFSPNVTFDFIAKAPGNCRCPSDCSSSPRGQCPSQGNGCLCASCYNGPDCSSVSCPLQSCSSMFFSFSFFPIFPPHFLPFFFLTSHFRCWK